MHSGFIHRKFEIDYYDSLKKLLSLLVEQLQAQLQIQLLINQKQFTNQLLGIYTRISVLENQRKVPSYPDFGGICQKLYQTIQASAVMFSANDNNEFKLITRKRASSSYNNQRLFNTQETETLDKTLKTEVSVETPGSRKPRIIPRQMFQGKELRKLFIQSNQPPQYITNSPQSLELHQRLQSEEKTGPKILDVPNYT